MALTSSAAIKAWLEAQGLGITVARDKEAEGATLPYVTVAEQIALVPDTNSSMFDPAGGRAVRETVQVSVWQRWRATSDNSLSENPALTRSIIAALYGLTGPALAKVTTAPFRISGVKLVNAGPRLVERDDNIVQTPITVLLNREM